MSPEVFVKLLAIFAVVAIGWGAAKSGKLGAEEGARVLSAAAFYVFVPALLFRTTARIDFQRLDVRVIAAFFVPTLALVTVVYTALRVRASAGAAAAEPSVRAITSATQCRSAFRSPLRCSARPGSRCISPSSGCTH